MSKLKRFEFPDIAAAVTVSNGMNAASVHESSGSEKAQQIAQAFAELPVNTTQRAGRAVAVQQLLVAWFICNTHWIVQCLCAFSQQQIFALRISPHHTIQCLFAATVVLHECYTEHCLPTSHIKVRSLSSLSSLCSLCSPLPLQ